MAHIRQSRPYQGPDFQAKVVKIFLRCWLLVGSGDGGEEGDPAAAAPPGGLLHTRPSPQGPTPRAKGSLIHPEVTLKSS